MIKPAVPVNEASRIEALRSLDILDTAAEERFDRLTRLAKRLFAVPVVLIGLVDSDRLWFKSSQGLSAGEIPRDASFCGHTILGEDILVVPDASLDERFHDNPMVIGEPNFRFYAGCPLKLPNGARLGTFCLIDRQPRTIDDDGRSLLKDLAKMAEQEIAAVQLATMDELTLLSNRRGFMSLGQHALGVCARAEQCTSIFSINLDGFKAINDRFGQAEGDRALVTFAGLLKQTFRDSDVIGRLGGDEFVALMTSCSQAETEIARQRLQAAVEEHNRTSQRGYEIRFSVGTVAYEPIRHSSIDALLDHAGALMYEIKRQKQAA